jgi:hypothetical protein
MGMDDCLIIFMKNPKQCMNLSIILRMGSGICQSCYASIISRIVYFIMMIGAATDLLYFPGNVRRVFCPCISKNLRDLQRKRRRTCGSHSDSYAANLVPSMIKMGIDIWQGCVTTNNVPELVKEIRRADILYGDIDNGVVAERIGRRRLLRRKYAEHAKRMESCTLFRVQQWEAGQHLPGSLRNSYC